VPGAKYDGLMAVQGDILGIALGVVFIIVAFVLPERLAGEGMVETPAE
jgi:hypothetical protein